MGIALFGSACSTSDAGGGGFTSTLDPGSAQSQVGPVADPTLGVAFLGAVCPVSTALKAVDRSVQASGGWAALGQEDVRSLMKAVAERAMDTVDALDARSWPAELSMQILETQAEHLALVPTSASVVLASGALERRLRWDELTEPRVSEDEVRAAFGLPRSGLAGDDCPDPNPASIVVGGSGEEWTVHWTSPSGRIDCAFTPSSEGSRLPTVACVTESGRYASLALDGDARPEFRSATDTDAAELSSPQAETVEYDTWIRGAEFECWQSPPEGPRAIGMTCGPRGGGTGFSIYSGGADIVLLPLPWM